MKNPGDLRCVVRHSIIPSIIIFGVLE